VVSRIQARDKSTKNSTGEKRQERREKGKRKREEGKGEEGKGERIGIRAPW
jgi:hypothetical protein